jgi:hypothetical protein
MLSAKTGLIWEGELELQLSSQNRQLAGLSRGARFARIARVRRIRAEVRRLLVTISKRMIRYWLDKTGQLLVVLTRKTRRPFDTDNLLAAFKPVRDAVADIILDGRQDSDLRLRWFWAQEPSPRPGIRIAVFSLHKAL